MGAKGADYYNRVAARFRDLAALEPERFRLIDANGSPEVVTARILNALADLF
jgi:dTMP kinase